MITSLNIANQFAYTKLFAEAYKDLNAKYPEQFPAGGKFTDIDSYFAHLADLLEFGKAKYILLPLDEEAFEINANTRTIKVPATFSRCASVQGDEMAEILMFTIDRYFDYMDLDTTKIFVQWTAPATKEFPTGREGVSSIQLKDVETLPGKVRFGWPLTQTITQDPGKVKFSIRFIKRKDVEEDGKTISKIVYSFNTLSAEITIPAALQPKFNETKVEDAVNNDYFFNAITNSQNPSFEDPAIPNYSTPGTNLPTAAALVGDNGGTLKLEAQAVVHDNGIINYKWYFKPVDTESFELVDSTIHTGLEVKEEYKSIPADVLKQGRVKNEVYYEYTGNGPAGYEEYNGEITGEDGIVLYERFTTLTIKPGTEEVVGDYQVKAINTKTFGETSRASSAVKSNVCTLPAPEKVVFTTDLPAVIQTKEVPSVTNPVDLKVEIAADVNSPTRFYNWEKKINTTWEPETDTDNVYRATDSGWYKVTAYSFLNRKTESAESQEVKVIGEPKKPVISKISYIKNEEPEVELTEEASVIDLTLGQTAQLIVAADVDIPEGFAEELFTEGLTYEWYVTEPEKASRLLTTKDIGKNSLIVENTAIDTNVLNIRCIKDEAVYDYTCKVYNTLNGKKAEEAPIFTIKIS